jgi:hypothetical protein
LTTDVTRVPTNVLGTSVSPGRCRGEELDDVTPSYCNLTVPSLLSLRVLSLRGRDVVA